MASDRATIAAAEKSVNLHSARADWTKRTYCFPRSRCAATLTAKSFPEDSLLTDSTPLLERSAREGEYAARSHRPRRGPRLGACLGFGFVRAVHRGEFRRHR